MKSLYAMAVLGAFFLAGCTPSQQPPPQAAASAPSGCNCSMTSIIFFDPGSAVLSPKNLAAVQQDATIYARQEPRPIIIAGGADAAEATTNAAVSLERAQAVAAQLEADGVAAADIVVRDNGSQHPMIPTAPGAAQIMNRYVMTQIQMVPVATAAPVAAGPFQLRGIVLYQPNAMLVARLGANGARPLSNYIGQIKVSLASVIAAAPPQPGVTAALVVGVKPSGAVRTWLVAPAGSLPAALAAQLQTAAQAVPPMAVQNGPIAFALVFNAWGGGAPITDAQHPAPMPPEWRTGAPGPVLVPDGVFARIWP
jgi:OmpA family